MDSSLIKPALIVLAGLFIVVMLNGCVVVPAEPVAYAEPAPAYGHHHHYRGHRHWRRGWTRR